MNTCPCGNPVDGSGTLCPRCTALQTLQLGRLAHLYRLCPGFFQGLRMRSKISLDGEDANARAFFPWQRSRPGSRILPHVSYQPRVCSNSR